MRCPYCGHNNPNTAKKCRHCGRSLDSAIVKRREKTILIYGIILIALILAAGIGAMFGVSNVLENNRSAEETSPQKVTIVTTPKPTEEAVVSESQTEQRTEVVEAETTPVPEIDEELLKGSIVDENRMSQISLLGYSKVNVASSTASSTIQQDGIDNTPHVMYDGVDWSCWQDGVDGDGIGENITFTFDRVYKIKFLVFKLGNWYGTEYYEYNNRPAKMTFEVGNESFDVTFPDEKKEICVELNREVEVSSIRMTINSVHKGSLYEDTCINEVTIYGYGTGAETAQATTIQQDTSTYYYYTETDSTEDDSTENTDTAGSTDNTGDYSYSGDNGTTDYSGTYDGGTGYADAGDSWNTWNTGGDAYQSW